jgi:hypothetical protein
MDGSTKVELSGVPETALWNLYQRATAARAPVASTTRTLSR